MPRAIIGAASGGPITAGVVGAGGDTGVPCGLEVSSELSSFNADDRKNGAAIPAIASDAAPKVAPALGADVAVGSDTSAGGPIGTVGRILGRTTLD